MYLEFGKRLIISLNLGLTISLYSFNSKVIRSLSSFLLLNNNFSFGCFLGLFSTKTGSLISSSSSTSDSASSSSSSSSGSGSGSSSSSSSASSPSSFGTFFFLFLLFLLTKLRSYSDHNTGLLLFSSTILFVN